MSLRDILWHNEGFELSAAVWILEGTAYNDDDEIVEVVYRIPDEVREDILNVGRIVGGINNIPVVWENVTPRDRPKFAPRKFHTHGTAIGRILGR